MPSAERENDELKVERSEIQTLPEPLSGAKDQISQPQDCGTNVPNRRGWFWTDSCQSVIEKCDVWTAILKIPQ